MKLQVIFKQENPDFDQDYADEYHDGKESDGNWKDIGGTNIGIPIAIKEINLVENSNYRIAGLKSNGESFEFIIPDMTMLECIDESDNMYLCGISKTLLNRTSIYIDEKKDIKTFYFYFENTENFVEHSESIYISTQDYPKELLKYARR